MVKQETIYDWYMFHSSVRSHLVYTHHSWGWRSDPCQNPIVLQWGACHMVTIAENVILAPHLSNKISLIQGSRIKWKSLSCPQFRPYSYQILCHVWGTSPQDTRFGNCRNKIVDSRAFLSWSLILGSSWSGLIKLGSGPCLNIKTVFSGHVDSHYKDEIRVRPSYLYYGNPYTQERWSLYWDGPLISCHLCNICKSFGDSHNLFGADSILTCHVSSSMGIPIVEIRQSNNHLDLSQWDLVLCCQYRNSHCGDKTVLWSSWSLTVGFPILVRQHRYIEWGHWLWPIYCPTWMPTWMPCFIWILTSALALATIYYFPVAKYAPGSLKLEHPYL